MSNMNTAERKQAPVRFRRMLRDYAVNLETVLTSDDPTEQRKAMKAARAESYQIQTYEAAVYDLTGEFATDRFVVDTGYALYLNTMFEVRKQGPARFRKEWPSAYDLDVRATAGRAV